jgi:CRISPR-associated protein Cmr5
VKAMQKDNFEAKYRTLAFNFPTMVMQSGLAQAIGFLMAKGKR